MRFTKMHGLGNDFVLIDAVAEPALATRSDWPEFAIRLCDRRFGIGADGVLLLSASAQAPAQLCMRIFNADGSEAEMCGNGLRCVGKYALENSLVPRASAHALRVGVMGRVLTLDCALDHAGIVSSVRVDMGAPVTDLSALPVDPRHLSTPPAHDLSGDLKQVSALLREACFIAIPNPHAVMFVSDVAGVPVERLGPMIETHRVFPQRINAQFVQALSRREARMRTWERGAGQTFACGTGAAAVCVAGVMRGLLDRQVLIHLPGGDLNLEWRESDSHILMTGPAVEVFAGTWKVP